MYVELIEADDLTKVYVAARTCYHPDGPLAIMRGNPTKDDVAKLITKCIQSNHMSVLEHATYTFGVEGISRACSHQLVRHRMASYSQKSQRYVKDKNSFKYVTPPAIELSNIQEIKPLYDDFMESASSLYDCLIKAGVKPEDARYIYPNACETSIVITMNLRELIHFCNERMCTKAQWEIRRLAYRMAKLVSEKEPLLKPYLKPKCYPNNGCREEKPCGLYDKEMEGVLS